MSTYTICTSTFSGTPGAHACSYKGTISSGTPVTVCLYIREEGDESVYTPLNQTMKLYMTQDELNSVLQSLCNSPLPHTARCHDTEQDTYIVDEYSYPGGTIPPANVSENTIPLKKTG